MRILYLTAFFPYPPNSGGRLRVKNMLDGLTAEHEVHLLSLGIDENDRREEHHTLARERCRSVTVVPHRPRRLQAALRMALSGNPYELNLLWSDAFADQVRRLTRQVDPDVVWCSRITTAQYVPQIHQPGERLIVLDQHDLASYLWSLIRASGERLHQRLFAQLNERAVARFERNAYHDLDLCISVSEHERQLTAQFAPPSVELLVAPNGVDTDYFQPGAGPDVDLPAQGPVIAMVGQMNGLRNIDAALFFAQQIFPSIRARHVAAEFWIVGGNPDRQIQALADQAGITVTGFVDDVRPYLRAAQVVVLPHRMGSGVKHKLPIAMAAGKCVITTRNGCQGLAVQDGEHLLIRDDAEGLADAACRLLDHPDQARALGLAARELVEREYDWRKISAGAGKRVEAALAAKRAALSDTSR